MKYTTEKIDTLGVWELEGDIDSAIQMLTRLKQDHERKDAYISLRFVEEQQTGWGYESAHFDVIIERPETNEEAVEREKFTEIARKLQEDAERKKYNELKVKFENDQD